MSLGEFDLIRRHFDRPVQRQPLGVGDDCALLAPAPGQQLAVSTDLLVEGRHFLSTVAPQALGHKALAVNLSDLAACGAEPMAYTLSLALPRVDDAWLAAFASGLHALADAHAIELVGGDTTAGPLTVGITVMGQVPPGQALLRSGARPGDALWVSGWPGRARLWLEAVRGTLRLEGASFEAGRLAMEYPQPRVSLGLALRGVASSAIDLSDGLIGDLGHVLERSGAARGFDRPLGAEIDAQRLPRHPALSGLPARTVLRCLLAGGDDYELLFTAPPSREAAVHEAARQAGVAVHAIGRITEPSGVVVRDGDGVRLSGHWSSYDHFRSEGGAQP
ncbi:thiamine-phosphate kinase [Leptothrix discophora]|uniref:Thiamine-monophosphate kinase n=1 Tax=Leptothrix discophora TaxID=89 RepID=A0ABT9G8Y5_LEPDI|nr:thiamine-phosphate kinase [Leptothrix discophora]MDP4302926.1 thiamine-phosphate kinase [Leptothrix discophora]